MERLFFRTQKSEKKNSGLKTKQKRKKKRKMKQKRDTVELHLYFPTRNFLYGE